MKIDNRIIKILILTVAIFNLTVASESLNDVIVTAKVKSQALDTAGSFSVITAKEIESMNTTSIQEVLKEVVGINLSVNNGAFAGRETISMRGADSRHTLILIDGKRVSGTDAQIGHSNFQYNWLPMNAIEKIEVLRGPMSSLYGSSAIGGVVNIVTKKIDKKLTGSLDVEFGKSSRNGGDEKDISLSLGSKINDKLSISIFAQKQDIELTKNDSNSSLTSDREGKKLQNGMVNLWYDIDDTQQVKASYMRGDEVREVLLYSLRRGSSVNYDKYYDIDKTHYSLDYQKQFSGVGLNLQYYKTQSDSHSQQFNYTHKMDDEIFGAEFDMDSIKNHYIIFGAEYREEEYHKDYDSALKTDYVDSVEYKSFYLQDEIELNEEVFVTIGGRYDKQERFGGEFSPKIYFVYKLDKNSRIKGGYAEGFNAPTVTQGSSDYKVTSMFIISGDDNLKPESSKSYELSYIYQNDKTSLTTTLFYTKIKNLIDTKKIGEKQMGHMVQNILKYSNVDRAKMQGLELELEQRSLFDNLDLHLGYNYLKTEDETTRKALYARPNHSANLRLSYRMPYGMYGTVRVNYVGKQRDYNDKALSPYLTTSFQIKKDFSNGMSVRVGIENLTDKRLDNDHNYQLKNRLIYGGINYKF